MALRQLIVAAVSSLFLMGAAATPDQQGASRNLPHPDGRLLAQNGQCEPPACTKRPKPGKPEETQPPQQQPRRPQPDIPALPPSQIPGSRPVVVAPVTIPDRSGSAPDVGQGRPVGTSMPIATNAPNNVAEGIVARHVGFEKFGEVMKSRIENFNTQINSRPGFGTTNGNTFFDVMRPGTGRDSGERPGASGSVNADGSVNTFFQPKITPAFKQTTRHDAEEILKTHPSIGGGIDLEGAATGLGPIQKIQYHAVLNALMLDNRSAYFFPLPGRDVAVLCRALAQDNVLGVSVAVGGVHLVYGKMPLASEPAAELTLADSFLGNIVFADDSLADYRFADNYQPKQYRGPGFPMLVHFNFGGYRFEIADQQIRAANFNFSAEIFPISATKGRDGGMLPDYDAIAQGKRAPEYEENAQHLANHIDYYRKERIVELAFQYGEVAALLRGLKADGVELNALAASIESAIGPVPQPSAAVANADPKVRSEHEWEEYLKEIQEHDHYANWSGPPYDLYVKRLAQSRARSAQTFRVIRVASNDVLNIRSGPSADHSIVGSIPPSGRGVHIIGACAGQWCGVEYGGTQGWANGYFLAPEQGQAGDSYRVANVAANDVLNLRQGPGARYPIVGMLPPDTQGVRLLGGQECVGVWCEVQRGSAKGWANTLYLTYEVGGTAAPAQTYRVINVAPDDVLNIRSGPGASLAIIGSIPPNGRGVRIVGSCAGQWCQIDYRGTRGWVNRQYLSSDL